MRNLILAEVETLLEQQPLLTKSETDDGLIVCGKYKICNQFEDEVYEDYFALEIYVPDGFPVDIPTVKTTDGRIRANNYKGHVYENGQFCMDINTAIAEYLQGNPSLLTFLTRYLDSYLFGFLYYRKHKIMPFGEHKHGIPGLMDYYCKLFDTADIKIAYSLLSCIFKDNLKGHILCPCQSGQHYRDCHRERINELRSGRLYERYKSDYEKIVSELSKKKR